MVRVDAWFAIAGGVLERAAILQVRRGADRAERAIADSSANARRDRTAPDHYVRVCLRQRSGT